MYFDFQSNITDWIQTIIGLIALIITILSLKYSRKANKISYSTIVRPVDIKFNQSNECMSIILYNSGPGIAFNIKVKAYQRVGYTKRFKKIRVLHKQDYAFGKLELQPNESFEYKFPNITVFNYHFKRPIQITYQLSSGEMITNYWKYMMGSVAEEQQSKIIILKPVEVIKYKLYKKYQFDTD